MQSERTHKLKDDDDRDDWGVLVLLIGDHDHRPWSVDEIIREKGDKIAALDALDRLRKAGLIHQTQDELVFPTRAALHYTQIRT